MSSLEIFLFTLTLVFFSTTNAHNITDILKGFPEYSIFNSYLSQTKLADEINSRQTITVLCLNNGAMSNLAGKHPLSYIKNALAVHVLLDYYDGQKLHEISNGTTLSTTLYQTTGNAGGNLGFVNITDLKGGKVGFGSGVSGSRLDSSYTKSIKQIPYNISLLEISAPIVVPGMSTAPAPSASGLNITALLDKAGCKTFASLILSTGVLKVYQTAADKGLTIFAPSDEAFKAPKIPDLSKLTNAELVSLLQYHAIADYTPIGTLKSTKDSLATLATNGAGKYDLSVTTAGDSVTLDTGVDSSRIATTVLDSTPLCIFTVDSILLPTELFGKAPSPAPAPVPEMPPSPSPAVSSPSPSAESPSSTSSPPAPPMSTPTGAPADSPSNDSQNSTSDKNAGEVRTPALINAVVAISASVIMSLFLS